VFGPRPVDLAAKKLVDEFGVAINVEDPLYVYGDDVQFPAGTQLNLSVSDVNALLSSTYANHVRTT
jgi:hypothetical protein